MKILQFVYPDDPKNIKVGVLVNGFVVDVNKVNSSIPPKLIDILKKGQIGTVKAMAASAGADAHKIDLNSVTLKAPITEMDKILGIDTNYPGCCKGAETPGDEPMIFSKFPSCAIGSNEEVKIRELAQEIDCEVELAVVMGREATELQADDALDYILGYTVAQDITARDWVEQNSGQLTFSKGMDGFCPLGPCITTADEVGDPHNLRIQSYINGTLKQDGNTSKMIHDIPSIIERITSVITLYPGDVILTGSPVGIDSIRQTTEFIKPGDAIKSEIEKIGALHTPVGTYVNPNTPTTCACGKETCTRKE